MTPLRKVKLGHVLAFALALAPGLAPGAALGYGDAAIPASYGAAEPAAILSDDGIARVSYSEVPYPTTGTLPGDPQRIVIDFEGGQAADLALVEAVQPVVTLSGGEVLGTYAEPLDDARGWRLVIDFDPQDERAIELRAFLRLRSQALTETWSYSWTR